jgi:hypothetical protein
MIVLGENNRTSIGKNTAIHGGCNKHQEELYWY